MTSQRRRITKGNDRRARQRYAMRWPLLFRGAGQTLESDWKRGRLIDMSACGLLAGLPEGVLKGAICEIAMDWPGLYHDKPVVRLYLEAVVVRTDARGTAFRILGHEFGLPARRVDKVRAVA